MTAILEPPTTAPAEPAPPVARQQPVDRPVPAPATPPSAVPPVGPSPEARRTPPVRPVLTSTGVRLIGAALVALFVVGYAVEPAADGPQPVPSLAVELIGTAMTILMLVALAGFARGRRWALTPALAFGSLLAVNVALCPATGHHQLAGWWFTQVAVSAAMVALPLAALARTRAG